MSELTHSDSNAIVSAISSLVNETPKQNETYGSVTRVDTNGTMWVRFDDGTVDTPCTRSTASAKAGDRVSVRVINARAAVTGNITSPATDDSLAKTALARGATAIQAANVAGAAARQAVMDAGLARDSAKSAETSAKDAHDSAEYARTEAREAISNALAALAQLGTVEDVMGTLAWIKDHEVFVPATSFDPTGAYYVLVDGKFEQVDNPTPDELDSYYVYDHESTMANFLQSHLTLTQKGLYITQSRPDQYQPDDDDYLGHEGEIRPTMGTGYMLLTGENTEIYGANGQLVARYGAGIDLADSETGKIVAWIQKRTLHISKAEIEEEFIMNNWVWQQRGSGNISFKWREA